MNRPSSLSEAISQLEKVSGEKAKDFKEFVEEDFKEIRTALSNLKPFLDSVKSDLNREAKAAQDQIEQRVRENPLASIGIVGFFAFLLGLLLGNSRK